MKITERDKVLLVLLGVILIVALAVVLPGVGVMSCREQLQTIGTDSEELQKELDEKLAELNAMGVTRYQEDRVKAADYLEDTINRVFRVVYECPTDGTNCILFASDNPDVFSVFDANTAALSGEIGVMMGRVREHSRLTEKGNRILTDDRAPVELLGMKALDAMIKDELEELRKEFRGKSLFELIDLLN